MTIQEVEGRLWKAADQLWANTQCTKCHSEASASEHAVFIVEQTRERDYDEESGKSDKELKRTKTALTSRCAESSSVQAREFQVRPW